MVVLGGMATVFGPLVGAIALLVSEELLKALTDHWMAILGPLIVLVVLTARRGIYGYLLDFDAWRERRRQPDMARSTKAAS
jgi:branched-chain amino acid transport system permease protein